MSGCVSSLSGAPHAAAASPTHTHTDTHAHTQTHTHTQVYTHWRRGGDEKDWRRWEEGEEGADGAVPEVVSPGSCVRPPGRRDARRDSSSLGPGTSASVTHPNFSLGYTS